MPQRPPALVLGGWRWAQRRSRAHWIVGAAGVAAFGGYVLWQAASGPPRTWNDTAEYWTVADRPLFSAAFWVGPRPPLVPLVLKLSGSNACFVAVQTLVFVAAWTALAVTVAGLPRRRSARFLAGALVLAFATTQPMMQWNRSVLSESFALSSLAMCFGSILLWARRRTPPRGAAVLVAVAWFVAVRDTDIWIAACLAVVLGAALVAGALRHHPMSGWRADAVVVVAVALLTALALGGAIASRREIRNIRQALSIRIFPYPERVRWFGDHGMPQIDRIRRLARHPARGDRDVPVVWIDTTDPTLARLAAWLDRDAPRAYAEWLILHPGFVLHEPFVRPERTAYNADGRLGYYAAADRSDIPLVTGLFYPPGVLVVAAAMAVLVVGTHGGRWRRRDWRLVSVAGALGVVHMLIAWHGDGLEVTRHALIGNSQARLGVLILFAMLLGPSRARPRHRDNRVPQHRVVAPTPTAAPRVGSSPDAARRPRETHDVTGRTAFR